VLTHLIPKRWRDGPPTVPVVRLSGVIGMMSPLRPGLSLASVAGSLEKAFAMKSAPLVALSINSPGGSPVQSHLIFQRIRQLAEAKDKPVIVFCEDVAASGGYMIAAAGDEIFADPSSIVGSIGVISQGFGFVQLIDRIGVERRVYTAGDNKAVLDPFRPENPEDVAHLKRLQADVHGDFIDLVKARRGARLADDPDLFTGLFWSGRRGVDLGLVDGLGDLKGVMTERYGDKVRLKLIQPARSLFGRRIPSGVATRDPPEALVSAAIGAVEERLIWARYGL
jgi:signal peptide peptidase SppA